MPSSLLRRVVFVAVLWSAVGLVSAKQSEAAYCEECATTYSECLDECQSHWGNDPVELQACQGSCANDYNICQATCDSAQCGARSCAWNEDCQGYCPPWIPYGVCSPMNVCCCPF